MTATCKEWRGTDGGLFHGLCANEFWPMASAQSNGCRLCVSPLLVEGECNACTSEIIPATYRVTLNIDGNGFGAANGFPDVGCGTTEYNREFLLYWVAGCTWQSAETELACYPSTPIVGGPYNGWRSVQCEGTFSATPVRPRVMLTIGQIATTTNLDTLFAVTAHWRTNSFASSACSVSAQGRATDCDQSVSCLFSGRTLRFNVLDPEGWANPFVTQVNGGVNITMTATVAPL